MLAAAQPEWNMTIYTAEQAGHFGRRRYSVKESRGHPKNGALK